MAKNKEKKTNHSLAYILAAIMLFVVSFINMSLVDLLWGRISDTNTTTGAAMNAINTVDAELLVINNDVLRVINLASEMTNGDMLGRELSEQELISTQAELDQIVENISLEYDNIEAAEKRFEKIKGLSDNTKRRYNHAKALIDTYHTRLENLAVAFREDYSQLGNMNDLYVQDIYPLQVNAAEMLKAAIAINGADTGRKQAMLARVVYLVDFIMFGIMIVGELAILFIARYAKKSRLELEEREKNLAEVGAKLQTSRQNVNALALSNILTGMKNRYALDNDITERLDTDRFVIAVFDMDNFRTINDNYGYDFGDEYLTIVADKLKEDFGRFAEIYNITGNEFCFVFNREISEGQAIGISQNILTCMSSPFVVLNLSVQLTATGALHTYLPGDCSNLNQLLVKLDTAMRDAKRNGGNVLVQTNQI